MPGLHFDADGRWRTGTLSDYRARSMEATFLDATTPTWATVTSPGAAAAYTGDRRLALSTGATVGGLAAFQFANLGNTSSYTAVLLEFGMTNPSSANADLEIGYGSGSGNAGGGNQGSYVKHKFSTGKSCAAMAGVEVELTRCTLMTTAYRNLGMLFMPYAREVYVLEGDEIIDFASFAGFNQVANVAQQKPYISVTAQTAADVKLNIGRARVVTY